MVHGYPKRCETMMAKVKENNNDSLRGEWSRTRATAGAWNAVASKVKEINQTRGTVKSISLLSST